MIDTQRLSGIAASPGISSAPVTKLLPLNLDLDNSGHHVSDVELIRYARAQKQVSRYIGGLKTAAAELHDEWVIKIFDSHLFLIRDPELQDNVIEMIKNDCVSAEWALLKVRDSLVSMLEGLGDSTMRERAADLRDLTDRIIAALTGQKLQDLSGLTEETIIAAVELSPLETSKLNKKLIKGIITEKGGYSCHTAIMARSSGIPAVTGVAGFMSAVEQGEPVIIDGERGTVIVRPGLRDIEDSEKAANEIAGQRLRIKDFIGHESLTKDGFSISIGAHLGSPDELENILAGGADGIGLFRTEFLFMQNQGFPGEQQQFEVYRKVLETMAPKPVIIRTMDIGGDKNLPWAGIDPEDNPFLGLRGIRYCLKRPDLFIVQLRALLRASVYGNLRIMFPMIALVDELKTARALLSGEIAALEDEGIELAYNIEVGMMIEVPSAALCAEQFAPYVDFFSIGTNDLIQYTMAADRMNDQVSYLYKPMHPAVFRLIKMVTDAAKQNGIWTGVCGEIAGDLQAVPILLGLGVTELSMAPPLVPAVRELVSRFSTEEMREIAEAALLCPSHSKTKYNDKC
jgi:phosphoenolpyruvate-protein phosphotransferase (PTS system enzyme I)